MQDPERSVFRLTGQDCHDFLQNLVTNDVSGLEHGIVWTGLLTPQGKYLADFFLVPDGDAILIDVAEPLSKGLLQRLSMYKLRADVSIEVTDIAPARGSGPTPDGAFPDPRHASLGWRAYDGRPGDATDWLKLRIAIGLPETGIELIPNESYPLEVGFEDFNGVDFRKGCYVGQEVTARMHHKTELKKGLRRVAVSGTAEFGTDILNAEGKSAGKLFSQSNGMGIAYLRFDRVTPVMTAGNAEITDATPLISAK